jgi:Lon protease-like protein
MSEELLSLFPLQVVLFPHARLPLHIFEERYKVLVGECIKDDREFGVNLLREGEISGVGCSAVVVSVLKKYDDGQMDIVVEGKRRYRVRRTYQERAPYLVGHVEYLAPAAETIDRRLADETIRLYNTLVNLVYREKVEEVEEGCLDSELSFLLAQKAGMDLLQRQQLLESSSEKQRLLMIKEYLTIVIPKLEQAGEIERIIRSDGYLSSSNSSEEE